MLRTKNFNHVTFLAASLGLTVNSVAACSSEDKGSSLVEDSPSSTGGSGTGGGSINIGTGGGTSLGTGGVAQGEYDGGTVPLTPEQAAEITNGACTGWKYEGEVLPSLIQLVVDVSSSMDATAPGTNQTKWEVTRDLLLEGIVGVEGPGLPASVSVGMLFYPNQPGVEATEDPQDVSACVNTSEFVAPQLLGGPTDPHRELIRTALENVVTEQWTPTHDALRYALQQGIEATQFAGNRFLLLITDGAPTISLDCTQQGRGAGGVDPEPIVQEITTAAENGIRTFLIGSPGSEANRDWMSRAAVIGGTAPDGCNVAGPVGEYCHMDMTIADDFTEALREGLARIAGVITPCSYQVGVPPAGQTIDQNAINVVMTHGDGSTKLIVRDDIGDCDEGWQLVGEDEIRLCPTSCAEAQAEPTTNVELAFGCESVVSVR